MDQKLWPAHCVQESWGSEFHKDLIVSNLLNSLKIIFMISYQFMPNNVRFIRNPRLFIKESIPKLILTQHSSTTPN